MLVPTIATSIQQNNTSTDFEDILLLILLPTKPPNMPEIIITDKVMRSVSGIDAEQAVKRRLADCAKKIIYRELSAAVFVFIEKKKYKTARLIGPPPMPRKDERTPNIKPIERQTMTEWTLLVLMRCLLSTYKRTPSVRMIIIMLCIVPTTPSLPAAFFITSKSSFPTTPPTAEPRARGVVRALSILASPPLEVISETMLIASTLHPDKKLICDTESGARASKSGLMITPPPIPDMAPRVVAIKHIKV